MVCASCRRYVDTPGTAAIEWPTEYVFVMHGVPGHTQAPGAVKRGAFKGGWTAAGLQSWCSKRAEEAVRPPKHSARAPLLPGEWIRRGPPL